MEIRVLTLEDMSVLGDAFMQAYWDDPYYKRKWPDHEERRENMRAFEIGMEYCVEQGHCLGIFDNAVLVAFFITCDWWQLREDTGMQEYILGEDYNPDIIMLYDSMGAHTQYGVLLSVAAQYKGQGLEQKLWQSLIGQFIGHAFVADVTDITAVRMYPKLGFKVHEIYPGYWVVTKS